MNNTAVSKNQSKYLSKNPLKQACLAGFRNKVLGLAGSLPVKNILDAGCGEGYIMREIKQARPDIIIDGFDRSEPALRQARLRLPHSRIIQGNIYHIPFPAQTYDLILALEILEHLARPEQALAELKKHAKEYVLLSVPLEPWFSLGNFLSGRNLRSWGNEPEHLRQWNKRQIVSLAAEYFKIKQAAIAFPWTLVLGEKK